MDISTIATGIGILASFIGIISWFNAKIEKGVLKERELTNAQMNAVGRTLDAIKEDIHEIEQQLARHSTKISQSDIVMVHIDETLKQLTGTVSKLDDTLNALKVAFAKIER